MSDEKNSDETIHSLINTLDEENLEYDFSDEKIIVFSYSNFDWNGVGICVGADEFGMTEYGITLDEFEPLFIKRDSLSKNITNLETKIKNINSSENSANEILKLTLKRIFKILLKQENTELNKLYEKFPFLKKFDGNENPDQ